MTSAASPSSPLATDTRQKNGNCTKNPLRNDVLKILFTTVTTVGEFSREGRGLELTSYHRSFVADLWNPRRFMSYYWGRWAETVPLYAVCDYQGLAIGLDPQVRMEVNPKMTHPSTPTCALPGIFPLLTPTTVDDQWAY